MAELKYSQAMKQLNGIIERIENEDVDVDELSKQVKEAVKLIQLCKDKIEKAEMDVKNVVESLQKKSG